MRGAWCRKGQTGKRVGWTCRIGLEIQERSFSGMAVAKQGHERCQEMGGRSRAGFMGMPGCVWPVGAASPRSSQLLVSESRAIISDQGGPAEDATNITARLFSLEQNPRRWGRALEGLLPNSMPDYGASLARFRHTITSI
jgi:hypothetical protein